MRQAMWKIVAVVAVAGMTATTASANSIVGVNYSHDRFDVSVNHGYGYQDRAVASVDLSSAARQIDEVRTQITPIWGDDPGLTVWMTFYGRLEAPGKPKRWLHLGQAVEGLELGSSLGGGSDDQKVVDYAHTWVYVDGFSWSGAWTNYHTFPYGKGSLNQPMGFQWTFAFTGSFEDPVKGRATLAALPEPSAALLLIIGAVPFLRRRR